jgi:hypothetical protein
MRTLLLLLLLSTTTAQAFEIHITWLAGREPLPPEPPPPPPRRLRAGPLAMLILGAIGGATGLILANVGINVYQGRTTQLDALNATVTTTPGYGRNNWIEIGVGVPLVAIGTAIATARIGELTF